MSDNLPDIPGYAVETELGRGGMGVVYRVRRQRDGAVLALKMILHARGASLAELVRFRIEAEALACLNHPNIVKIRDVGVHGGYPFIAIEFAAQGSLKEAIARGRQKPRSAAEIVHTVALAMQHAHERGMLHRDLKPANVLLMEDGTPKVSDFGLVKFAAPVRDVSEAYRTFQVNLLDLELARFARELEAQFSSVSDTTAASEDELTRSAWEECARRTGVFEDGTGLQSVRRFLSEAQQQTRQAGPELDGLTGSGAIMGSPNYMAPEQAQGDLSRIGPRTDVYALGGILYELLTGQPPFRAASLGELLARVCSPTPPRPPRELAPDLSADIEAICLKCLAKAPEGRYPSAAELAGDLSRFLDGYVPSARSTATSAGTRSGSSESTQDALPTRTTDAYTPQQDVGTDTDRPESRLNPGTALWMVGGLVIAASWFQVIETRWGWIGFGTAVAGVLLSAARGLGR